MMRHRDMGDVQMRKLAGALVLTVVTGAAQAQDVIVYGGAALDFTYEEFGPGSGTTTYLSGYSEFDLGGFYAGVWAQLASDDLLDEVDLYLGYRSELASGLSYNAYYTRYYYPNDGYDGGGEFALEVDVPVTETFAVGTEVYYTPAFEGTSSLWSGYVGGAFLAGDFFEISGLYGSYEVDGASNEEEWELGATYFLGEETSVDFRYYDGTEYESSYLGLTLAWDTTLLGG
jgi:hypothetical protein